MKQLRFAKINLRVRDLDSALAYARDVLGAEVLRERNTISFGEMALVRYGGLIIEILAPDRPDSSLAKIIEQRGEGIDSLGLYADDVNASVAELEANGARIASNDGSVAWLHPKNPLSLSVELFDPTQFNLERQA